MHGKLPDICAVEITELDEFGEALAIPLAWDSRRAPPHILLISGNSAAPSIGDHALVKLKKQGKNSYSATLIRILPRRKKSARVLGVLTLTKEGMLLEPTSRKEKNSFKVAANDSAGAQAGEVVLAELMEPSRRGYGLQNAKVVERLGTLDAPRAASLIAIYRNEIPTQFSQEAIHLAEDAAAPVMTNDRKDLRDYALVTIDGEDARDFDDAVWAEPDSQKSNPGGWHLLVAIADVAHYVKSGDALDREAAERGNSVYFPDRVVPMLPEALSNGLCSLKPEEDRYCLAVHLYLTAEGELKRYQFVRGLMRSRARLTYVQVQAMRDGREKHPLYESAIKPLYGVYASLAKARAKRNTLELELPEFKIAISEEGKVTSIVPRERLDSHKLIEECMIAANVAAAQAAQKAGIPSLYRVHETPDQAKLEDLRNFLESQGHRLARGQVITGDHFNRILLKVKDTPDAAMISTVILRAQMQAYYHASNHGHFGLGLAQYAHFTSPIRRYSDLVMHRALIAMLDRNAPDGMTPDQAKTLGSVAEHISMTERRAMLAEREANDRYVVAYMRDQVGRHFLGVITSVTNFGLFVTLQDTGATGFIPLAALGDEFYQYNKAKAVLIGRRTGHRFQLGQTVEITLVEANTLTGSLQFQLNDAVSKTHGSRVRAGKMDSAKGKKSTFKGGRKTKRR